MKPVVGYHGGKRRLLKEVRKVLRPVHEIRRYVEPFVGMGAVYLDLRSRGYKGPAVLADANPCVADFWRFVHDERLGQDLIDAASALDPTTDPDVYSELLRHDEPNTVKRVAKFLWITNYAYANVAPIYRGGGNGWVGSGCKLTSAAKWNKTFPWDKCVMRLCQVAASLRNAPCIVLDNADSLKIAPEDVVYADPPYLGRRGYVSKGNNNKEERDFAPLIFSWRPSQILYSESREIELPEGWDELSTEIVARASKSADAGAVGKRKEHLYFYGGYPNEIATIEDLFGDDS